MSENLHDSKDVYRSKEEQTKFIRSKTMGIGFWNAYCKTQEYLNIKPSNNKIDNVELRKHTKPDDMWIALGDQGKLDVYDITKFAKCHPGGSDILLEHAGTDASEAFRMAHFYINLNMISRLKVGTLVSNSPGQNSLPNQLKPITPTLRLSSITNKPRWNWTECEGKLKFFIDYANSHLNHHLSGQLHQQLNQLRLIAIWNSDLTATSKTNFSNLDARVLLIRVLLDNNHYHCFEIKLNPDIVPKPSTTRLDSISSPASLSSSSSSPSVDGRGVQARLNMEFELGSNQTKSVSTLGLIIRDTLSPFQDEQLLSDYGSVFIQCTINKSIRLNNSTYRLLQITYPTESVLFLVPYGHHVALRIRKHDGSFTSRLYTPVCDDITMLTNEIKENKPSSNRLTFLIKIYDQGHMSQLIDQLEQDHQRAPDLVDRRSALARKGRRPSGCVRLISAVNLRTIDQNIEISLPMSDSTLFSSQFHLLLQEENSSLDRVIMYAAGSGITVMLRFISSIINHSVESKTVINLLWFNRTQDDVSVLIREFENLRKTFPSRITVNYVLSEPVHPVDQSVCYEYDCEWIEGQICEDLCVKLLKVDNNNTASLKHKCCHLICGPVGFNKAAVELMNQWEVKSTNYHVFM